MAQKRPAPPTGYAIFDYWRQNNDGFIDYDYFETYEETGKCFCFACGIPVYSKLRSSEAKKWSTCSLQKAHIIPFGLGGSNEPDNFMLLCPECHAAAPDIKDDEAMKFWCTNRGVWWSEKLSEIFKFFFDNPWYATIERHNNNINYTKQELFDYLSANGAMHGTSLAPSTIGYLCAKFIYEKNAS